MRRCEREFAEPARKKLVQKVKSPSCPSFLSCSAMTSHGVNGEKMRILSKKALRAEKGIGYSDVHIARLVKAGKFPAPIQLGAGRKGWIESEVDIWLEARPRVAWAPKSQPPCMSGEVPPSSALPATD